jgi:hypothetical protein
MAKETTYHYKRNQWGVKIFNRVDITNANFINLLLLFTQMMWCTWFQQKPNQRSSSGPKHRVIISVSPS